MRDGNRAPRRVRFSGLRSWRRVRRCGSTAGCWTRAATRFRRCVIFPRTARVTGIRSFIRCVLRTARARQTVSVASVVRHRLAFARDPRVGLRWTLWGFAASAEKSADESTSPRARLPVARSQAFRTFARLWKFQQDYRDALTEAEASVGRSRRSPRASASCTTTFTFARATRGYSPAHAFPARRTRARILHEL